MFNRSWSLWDDGDAFEFSGGDVRTNVWKERPALYLDDCTAILRESLHLGSYRLQAEIACPNPVGFVGILFGARDFDNCELVYVSPGNNQRPGEIQYDPRMHGSSTWQIYQGPAYQAHAPFEFGQWTKLTLEVHPDQVSITVGEGETPQLIIPKLQLGRLTGEERIGVWSHMPAYMRNLTLDEIHPVQVQRKETNLEPLSSEGYVTEWEVSSPYRSGDQHDSERSWTTATVEENGTLNLNRLYPSEQGTSIIARCTIDIAEDSESVLSFGFSDSLRLWVDDVETYQGTWLWAPPHSDGRIRADHVALPIHWQAGRHSIRAEIANLETIFGWGLSLKTGFGRNS